MGDKPARGEPTEVPPLPLREEALEEHPQGIVDLQVPVPHDREEGPIDEPREIVFLGIGVG